MISYEKIANSVIKIGKKVKEIWFKFWNSLLTSVRRIADQFMTRFKEKVEGVALAMKCENGSFKRVNSVYTKAGDGYKRTDIITDVDENDIPDELRSLQNGDTRDITRDFEDVLELEY